MGQQQAPVHAILLIPLLLLWVGLLRLKLLVVKVVVVVSLVPWCSEPQGARGHARRTWSHGERGQCLYVGNRGPTTVGTCNHATGPHVDVRPAVREGHAASIPTQQR